MEASGQFHSPAVLLLVAARIFSRLCEDR